MTLENVNAKLKTTPVAHQQSRKMVQLYASLKNIGTDHLNELIEDAKVDKIIGLGSQWILLLSMASQQSVTTKNSYTIQKPNFRLQIGVFRS